MASSADENNMSSSQEVLRSTRELSPSTYLLKIKNFPSLAKSIQENCESRLFEVAGYKWKLTLYPNGDKKANGEDHISLYLGIEDVASLPKDWEVFAKVEFFVYNQLQDNYLAFQENDLQRFHSSKRQRGFVKLLPLQTFNDPKNGYLVNGCCSFGVKVSVIDLYEKWECISIKDNPADGRFTWKIHKFSTLDKTFIYSDEFNVEQNKWKLMVYPKGDDGKNDSLSLYLALSDLGSLPENGRVHARAKLRVLDQRQSQHVEKRIDNWFNKGAWSSWGFTKTIMLKELYDAGKGFLVEDTLIVEVELQTLSATNYFP